MEEDELSDTPNAPVEHIASIDAEAPPDLIDEKLIDSLSQHNVSIEVS